MDPVLNDERFAHIATDVRFRSVPKKEQKVKIDKRFQSMFTGSNFKVKYSVDKRGRPNRYTTDENLKKYYDLSSPSASDASTSEDSDDEKSEGKSKKKSRKLKAKPKADEDSDSDIEGKAVPEEQKFDTDFARGEGALETSSSEEDSSDSDEEDQQGASGLIHPWGELDGGAIKTETITRRLAVCNMDWDRIAARDLYVLLNSFSPPGGLIKSVKVYLSDFGRERLHEEEVAGPKELTSEKSLGPEDESIEEGQEGEKYHMEKLREYQLNRLKYYYAVVECDSVTTASKIYDECDGLEYESSATRLDLRYIPDDMEFDQEAHSMEDGTTNTGQYQPKSFTTTALQQAKVKLTWDETNPDRLQVIQKAFDQGEEENMDLGAYLASSDSEDEEVKRNAKATKVSKSKKVTEKDEESENSENEDGILKYKALLKGIEESENKKDEEDDVHLEITWGTGLKEKTESLIKNRTNENITPWQQYLSQKKEKKRQKREDRKKDKDKNVNGDEPYSDDDLPSDVDLNDPFFKQGIAEETTTKVNIKKCKKKSKQKAESVEDDGDTKQKNAELELLMMEECSGLKHHYNLDKLLKKKTKSKNSGEKDNFQIDVEDPRFSAIFNSHAYNIDPSDPNFKRTEGMETLIKEKQKRKLKIEDASEAKQPMGKREKTCDNPNLEARFNGPPEVSGPSRTAELSLLIKSVKNKASNFKRKNIKRVS